MEECPECNNQRVVYVLLGVDYVTHDMAMDAGEMSMEGMPIEHFGWVDCPKCNSSTVEGE